MGLSVSHILHADDTLLFCNAEEIEVGYLRCVLLYFEAVSGLKVNLGKYKMIPIEAVILVLLLRFWDVRWHCSRVCIWVCHCDHHLNQLQLWTRL